ncbi:thioesterase family protein [Microbacterium sp.]|uniref:acyl-CoA thioesterase n=1 Tax=Microbacterium sp. TaxID=51671 RepID=UPI003221EAB0
MTDEGPDAEAAPGGLRVHVPIHLRWGDLDAFNHVNNVAMLKILEEARVRALWKDEGVDAFPTAVISVEGTGGVGTLIARQEIEYLRPVPYQREPLDVQLWFGRMGGASVEVCYEVHGPRGLEPAELYVRADAVFVLVNLTTGRPVRLPDEVRAAWTPYLGEPVDFTHRR